MFKKYRLFIIISILLLTLLAVLPFVFSMLFSKTALSQGKIVVNKQINAPFLSSIKKDNIVVFFGYVGCTKVCVPILSELNSIYESQKMEVFKKTTAFVFVNLTPEIPSDEPQIFARGFNSDFKGIYLSKRELFNIDREFALFYSAGLTDKKEIAHSDSVYLIKNENGKFILKNIYMTHPFKPDLLLEDIKNIQ